MIQKIRCGLAGNRPKQHKLTYNETKLALVAIIVITETDIQSTNMKIERNQLVNNKSK